MKMDYYSIMELIQKLDDVSSVDCANDVLGLVVDALDAIKKFSRFYVYWAELYGTGLQISGWHLNGEEEPFDTFYDSAVECME